MEKNFNKFNLNLQQTTQFFFLIFMKKKVEKQVLFINVYIRNVFEQD